MLGFINKNKILAFFAAMAATQTLLYIKTFSFYWSWGFFQKKTPPRPNYFFRILR